MKIDIGKVKVIYIYIKKLILSLQIQDLKHRGHQRTPSSLLCLSQSFLRSGLAVLNHSSQEALIPKRICEGGISSNTMKLEAKAMQCYDIYYYSVNKG